MVLIECTSAAGGVKLATAGSAAAPAATPLLMGHPQVTLSRMACPSIWDGLDLLGNSVTGLMGSVQHFTTTLSTAPKYTWSSFSAAPATNLAAGAGAVGTLGFLRSWGALRYWIQIDEDEDEDERPTGFMSTVRPCISLFSMSDAITVAAIISSAHAALDVPLRTFAAGGLVLSFPMTWLVDSVTRYYKTRRRSNPGPARGGFFAELLAGAAAFAWLAWGTVLVSSTQSASSTAPFLFWTSFGQCVLSWSMITVSIVIMILSTVLSLMFGAK